MSAHRKMLVNVSRVARSGQGLSFRANLSFSFWKYIGVFIALRLLNVGHNRELN